MGKKRKHADFIKKYSKHYNLQKVHDKNQNIFYLKSPQLWVQHTNCDACSVCHAYITKVLEKVKPKK